MSKCSIQKAVRIHVRSWLLGAIGASLLLVPRLAAQVWDGGAGTGTWATANNWSPNAVPGTGVNITFNAASANNQWTITLGNNNRTTGSITFSNAGGAHGFTFNTGTATLTVRGGIVNNDAATQTFNVPVTTATNNQTWNMAAGDLAFGNVTLGTNLTLTGGYDFSSSGVLTNSGGNRTLTNNSTGAVTLNSVNLSNNNTARLLTFSGTGTTVVNGVIANGGTGAGRIATAGSGTLVLNGANTYTGTTTVAFGTVRLGINNALPSGTAVTVSSGATLDLNGHNDTIGSLAGAGIVTLGSGTLTAGGNNASTMFSGAFGAGDTGTFAKTGTGTLTFGAGMDLSGGTLVLNGGTLNLGNFASTFGALNVTGNSILDFGTGAGSALNILGSLTIASGATLTVQNWTDTVDYFYSLFDPSVADSTVFDRIAFAGYPGIKPKWLPFDHEISPVPEPSVYGAALLGLSALFAGWRVRRRQGSR